MATRFLAIRHMSRLLWRSGLTLVTFLFLWELGMATTGLSVAQGAQDAPRTIWFAGGCFWGVEEYFSVP